MKAGKRRRWGIAGAALLVLLVAAGVAAVVGPRGHWASVRRADLPITVPIVGYLEAAAGAGLAAPVVPGQWRFKISFMAPEGSQVEAGAPVLRFDATELERELREEQRERDSALAELAKLKAKIQLQLQDERLALAEAEAELRRAELALKGPETLQTAITLRKAELDLDLARRTVKYHQQRLELLRRRATAQRSVLAEQRDRAEARVKEIQGHIAQLTIKAPRSGPVIYLENPFEDEEQKFQVGDSAFRGVHVLAVPDLSKLRATGEVKESQIGLLQVGQKVRLTLTAYPDRQYTGRIRRLQKAVVERSKTDPTRVVQLDLALDRVDEARMRPEMRFSGEVIVRRLEEVLLLPVAAVSPSPAGPSVQRRSWSGRETVHPRLGATSGEWQVVLSGLEEGDRVWVAAPTVAGEEKE